MPKTRENNYDLLRIICTISVILLHVSSIFVHAITDEFSLGGLYQTNLWEVCLYDALPRFAVPCFVMLSGAFVLNDERNTDFRMFYRKAWRKLGVPTLIFSACYTIFSMLKEYISLGGIFVPEIIIEPMKLWAAGLPYYHMWYLYMLIGLYLLVPFLIRLKKKMKDRTLEILAWIFLALGCLCGMFVQFSVFWDFRFSLCFLGYFLMGDIMRKKNAIRKNNAFAICMMICAILIEYAMAMLSYRCILLGEQATFWNYSILEPLSPMAACVSILVFLGFTRLECKVECSHIAKNTFYIYLIHAAFVTVYHEVVRRFFGISADARWLIPVGVIFVYFLSDFSAKICVGITNWIRKGKRIHEDDR